MVLVTCAVVLALASLVVSHFLVRDLEREERGKMEIWAEAMRTLSNAADDADLNLVLKVMNENNTIPVVVMDKAGNVETFRNVQVHGDTRLDSLHNVAILGNSLKRRGKYISVAVNSSISSDHVYVCYDDSSLLKRLETYPFIQLGVAIVFVFVAILALLVSKRAEQNKVWVGLSKETAHQLGTPISSLMAWIEILTDKYPEDELIPEINKDVRRLRLIADRFSKIGSLPENVPCNLTDVIGRVVDYMRLRISRRVSIVEEFLDEKIMVNINAGLFEWVIENLCKNAVDAMGGYGTITIKVFKTARKAIIEVSDTGKGIRRKDLSNVFRPGFTTKSRGWGLGLSLAKRIIEEYHNGSIFLKESVIGKGTVFRIELRNT